MWRDRKKDSRGPWNNLEWAHGDRRIQISIYTTQRARPFRWETSPRKSSWLRSSIRKRRYIISWTTSGARKLFTAPLKISWTGWFCLLTRLRIQSNSNPATLWQTLRRRWWRHTPWLNILSGWWYTTRTTRWKVELMSYTTRIQEMITSVHLGIILHHLHSFNTTKY